MAKITAPALVSSFARFVAGDIKGGAAAHAYRVEVIRSALEQMFKGNYQDIREASTLTIGKSKKARAYHAGFAALGEIGTTETNSKVAYIGKLTAPENKPVREQIALRTEAATLAFFGAFDAVIAEKAEPKDTKTKDSTPASGAAQGSGEGEGEGEAPVVPAAAVDIGDLVATVVTALQQNMLDDSDVESLRAALAAHAAMLKQADAELAARAELKAA